MLGWVGVAAAFALMLCFTSQSRSETCRQNSSARALESKQRVLDPTAPCWFVKQQFFGGEGWIHLVQVRNEHVLHFPWFSSAAWNHQRNTNKLKFCCKGLETSQFLGTTSPPEDSELFPAHLYHLYAFISSRALGQGSWQAETCCNFIFQIMVHELSHRHPQTRSDFWGHSSANWFSSKFMLDQSNNITRKSLCCWSWKQLS